MDWTLCLLCALISMTSTRCHQYTPAPYPQYDQRETNHDRQPQSGNYASDISDQATQRIREWVDERLSEQEDRATQRMSERSLPLESGQRLQELQRRRFNQDEEPRIVNGNKKPGFHLTPRRGVVPDPSASPDVVVFPGPSRRSDQPFVPNVPEECLRTGICEDLPDYPEDHVATIIEQLGDAVDKYKVDELDTPEIAQRIGPPEETELCEFNIRVVIPKAAPDKDGNWHYILNQKDKPLQGFHVEICKEDKSPCAKLAHFYSGYEASCKQKYMLRYMTGLNSSGQTVDKAFKLPSCCSCVVRQID